MKVNASYRTVILRLYPTPEQEEMLKECEKDVFEFLETSRLKLQNMLYRELKDRLNISRYTLALLTRRFTGSLGEKAMIPFDTDDNANFVYENNLWFLELQLFKGRGNRVKIPIAKTEVPYYDCIEELNGLPLIVVRENDEWFAYVSIPVKTNDDEEVIGVDFNLKKWVASPYEGRPLFFNASEYARRIDRLQKLISRLRSRNEETKQLYEKIEEITKLAHGNFLGGIKNKYGVCTLAIEKVETMYKLTEKGNPMVNNWLYKKVAMRKFALRAMTKGFNVVEVDPKNTTDTCHRCGNRVKIYGKHQRLIACERCGYKDYNRDLNSARNIVRRLKELAMKGL